MRLLKTAAALLLLGGVANAGTFFEDDFDGSALDSSKWNTDNATRNLRFCPTDMVNHLTYGYWVNVATSGCSVWIDDGYDYWEELLFQPEPYGFVSVGAGQASFSSDYRRTFPFVWAGPPSRASPFPAEGDFAFEIRLKYDFIGGHGAGVSVYYKPDTTPAGNSPPSDVGVYGVWADGTGFYGAGPARPSSDPYAYEFHTFRMEYAGGYVSAYVDGVLVGGPAQSAARPNAVFIGNPVFTAWGVTDWSDFTIDYVRVTVPETPVQIDIKPGSYPNSINLGSGGVVPVAILSAPGFDAATVDPLSITLASAPVQLRGNGTAQASLEDVNSDGLLDLVVQVVTEALQLSETDTEATLEGNTADGTRIRGVDSVRVVP